MRIYLLIITLFLTVGVARAQKNKEVIKGKDRTSGLDTGRNKKKYTDLNEVVITGQYEPQSLKNSVYQTRVINSEQIRLRAASNVQQVLSTELGFRFSNDMTLGTSDVQLMGMTGRSVKILLDGVPMIDRTDTRESLNQIDINTIERIEIVEGPLSVSYGSDALAGVINIITKKPSGKSLNINARVQEETVGNEYEAFSKKGNHLQHLGAGWQQKGWSVLGGLTHNDFNGFNQAAPLTTAADIAADVNRWKPKEQWLANTRLGYNKDNLQVWYRLDYVKETIDSRGGYNPGNYKSTNQKYITNRYTNQLQSEYRINEKLQFSGFLAYSNLKRTTRTMIHDYTNGSETPGTEAGQQDISKFNSTSIRTTAQYKMSDQVSFQPGIEVNLDGSSGARIKGSPSIQDYAFFISSELNWIEGITIRPGLRFIKNSIYNAPPVIPSLNTKIRLKDDLDLRLSYASGFRAPALRELYYDFFDASHSIMGNPNLKAEESNSFTGSLVYSAVPLESTAFRSVLSGFYNNFRNRIDFGLYAEDPTKTTLINISQYKTTGGAFENTLSMNNFRISLGLSYIGINNRYDKNLKKPGESEKFAWSPEVNTNVTYTFQKIGATVNLAYKFSGKKPLYVLHTDQGSDYVSLEKTGAFHTADLLFDKKIFKNLNLNAGVKNLFDITTISSTAGLSGLAHSAGGPVVMNYGRSYIVGLSYNWEKK
ncbi:TonB-dependent receptor [Pedobacter sp. HMWF019]|uniref:TonB-dependent receptor plug domain-containing protein n=1 Tax=Pedobacter sp. HMWF019 TaxID=2056856 RepID=UPI000D3CD275|nr:TonB-dependent receptor [Pedobacter sp. HMWF019]PTS96915.1 TonB-dependent receptor [Pedobacter sp. HMWF019]